MVLSTFRLLQPETYESLPMNRYAVANKRTVSNNNICYSVSFINRRLYVIKIITSDIDRGCWCAIEGYLTNIHSLGVDCDLQASADYLDGECGGLRKVFVA